MKAGGRHRNFSSGFSLIELLFVIAIVGLLFAFGAPSFSAWLKNMQVRNAAESIMNGLQFARTEAVRRNEVISFAMFPPDADWTVSTVIVVETLQSFASAEGAEQAEVATTDAVVTFNGLGKTDLAANALIQVTNPTGGAVCGTGVDEIRCLNVTVSVGGQIKMCDPAIATPGDSRRC